MSEDLRSIYNRCCIRQQGNVSGPLNSHRQHPLVFGTVAGNPARCNLASFGCKVPDNLDIFVIDGQAAVSTEFTYLSSMIRSFEFTPVGPVSVIICSVVCHFLPHLLCFFRPLFPSLVLRFLRYPPLHWPSTLQDPPCHSA